MLSGYRVMWIMVMFDLPVLTKVERKSASRFRLDLLDLGFEMTQLSVYMRFCASQAQVSTFNRKIQRALPCSGRVSVVSFTDKQYERIHTFIGGTRSANKNAPSQIELF